MNKAEPEAKRVGQGPARTVSVTPEIPSRSL
jgi:hypothetical protein